MITACIPTYNNENTISETLYSIFIQKRCDFKVLISDSGSTDKTMDCILECKRLSRAVSGKDIPIRIVRNSIYGCGVNLNNLIKESQTDILYFLCGDDVLVDEYALSKVKKIFDTNSKISIVSRFYYWFDKHPKQSVRVRKLNAHPTDFEIFQSFDQISGIAIRKKFIKNKCSNDNFIEIASILFPIWEENIPIVMVDNYPVAIRISSNMSPQTFVKSPVMNWYSLVKDYPDFVDYIACNYVGLVQIKNLGTYRQLFREIYYLVKLRPKNLFNLVFWFFVIGTILTPRWLIRKLIDIYRKIPK